MGCFDTLQGLCPKCGEAVSVQSKGGDCSLEEYTGAAPADVIMGADTIRCDQCGTRLKVQSRDLSLVPFSFVEVDE